MAKAKAVSGAKAQVTVAPVKIEVARIHVLQGNKGSTKAFADVTVADAVTIQGFRVVDGDKGLFVSFPQNQSKDGRYYMTTKPATRDIRNAIEDAVMTAYTEATAVKAVPVAA